MLHYQQDLLTKTKPKTYPVSHEAISHHQPIVNIWSKKVVELR